MPRSKNGVRPAAHPRGKSGVLAEVGKTLYGNHIVGLSALLDVSDKTIRRWLDGGSPIPDRVWMTLADALNERGHKLEALASKLAPYL